ncbi:MAG: Asp/Glu/hydantoin racemase [Gemmatimonas sp. SG8_17]|nr:MAG: Asp/Glu/hydantoin racemase [Gemmatimonas sp. SG8_17]
MRIFIINPNSDPDMTSRIQRSAQEYAVGEFEVDTRLTPGAPRFIETYQDRVQAAPGMMRLVRDNEPDSDAFVIACHSDPNVDAIKEMTERPVVGIGEASMKIATMLGHSFSVITTHRHSIPGKLAQARKYHLQEQLVSVRAPDEGREGFDDQDLFLALSRAAVHDDLAEVIVLGCAGLSGIDKMIQQALGVPVLDGVICALILATGLVRYRVSTSRAFGYDPKC